MHAHRLMREYTAFKYSAGIGPKILDPYYIIFLYGKNPILAAGQQVTIYILKQYPVS